MLCQQGCMIKENRQCTEMGSLSFFPMARGHSGKRTKDIREGEAGDVKALCIIHLTNDFVNEGVLRQMFKERFNLIFILNGSEVK